ncbi:MAG: hypothetical protein QOD01_413 [Actinomycetota bacterium]|nr:hypothetical protein [Actinomycetota bacterium]
MAATRGTVSERRRWCCSSSLAASASSSSPSRGIGRAVPGGRDPPPRAPGRAAPRPRGSGLTRQRCGVSWVAELGGSGWVRNAHAAALSPALQAVGTGCIMLENVGPVRKTQGLLMFDLAHPPGNPEDCGPSIGSLAPRCHSCYLPFAQTREGRPRSPPAKEHLVGWGSFSPGSPLPCRPGPPAPGCPRLSYRSCDHGDCWLILPSIKSGE